MSDRFTITAEDESKNLDEAFANAINGAKLLAGMAPNKAAKQAYEDAAMLLARLYERAKEERAAAYEEGCEHTADHYQRKLRLNGRDERIESTDYY